MARGSRIRLLALALAAVAVAVLVLRGANAGPAPPSERAPTTDVAPAPEAERRETAVAADPASEALAPALPPPTEGAALGPPRSSPPRAAIDPCADAEDDAPIERPTLGTLISDRVAELNDRMRAAHRRESSSEALREGLRLATDPATADQALALLGSAPDRVEDGFDLRVAVLVVLAANALGAADATRARSLARTAAREAPRDALPRALEALADERLGDPASAAEALAAAHALAPDEPSIAVALARHLRDGPDPAAAVAVIDGYLREVPEDAALARTRERLRRRATAMAGHRTTNRHGVTMVAPASTDRAAALAALEVVDAALTRSARLLGVERPGTLSVLVYATQEAMRDATCGRVWSSAMYDGALHVSADAIGSADGALALRHESLHATLHRALPNVPVPTWLDEGLAQYASGEHEVDAGVRRSFRLMVDERAVIPFASMDGAFLVIDDPTDARLAYHQALAMVLWLVERRGERGVADAIAHLARGGDPTRVLEEAARAPLDAETLRAFLAARP